MPTSIVIIILLAIPVAISIIFYRWIKRRGVRWAGLKTTLAIFTLFIVFPTGFLIHLNHNYFYPPNSFYIKVFENCTELPFPESGKILAKAVMNGHQYYEYAVIEFSETDFKSITQKISANNKFASIKIHQPKSNYYNKGPEGIDSTKILEQHKIEFESGFAIITFMNDRETIVLENTWW